MPVVPVIIPVPKVVPVITVPKVDCVLPKVAPKVDCLPDGPIYHNYNYNLAPTLTPKLKISAVTQKVAALTKPPPEDKRRARIRDFIKSFF
jgi:hypothetical protein